MKKEIIRWVSLVLFLLLFLPISAGIINYVKDNYLLDAVTWTAIHLIYPIGGVLWGLLLPTAAAEEKANMTWIAGRAVLLAIACIWVQVSEYFIVTVVRGADYPFLQFAMACLLGISLKSAFFAMRRKQKND